MTRRISVVLIALLLLMAIASAGLSVTAENGPPPIIVEPADSYPGPYPEPYPSMPEAHLPIIAGYPAAAYPEATP